jgi:hypothetical protein
MKINDIQGLVENWRYLLGALTYLFMAWGIWKGQLLNKPPKNKNSSDNNKHSN